jgi:hypothetical protein
VPVTVVSTDKSKTVADWVVILCIVVAVMALALLIKSCQRPAPAQESLDEPGAADAAQPPRRNIWQSKRARLVRSGFDVPAGSTVRIEDVLMKDSPVTFRSVTDKTPDSN